MKAFADRVIKNAATRPFHARCVKAFTDILSLGEVVDSLPGAAWGGDHGSEAGVHQIDILSANHGPGEQKFHRRAFF